MKHPSPKVQRGEQICVPIHLHQHGLKLIENVCPMICVWDCIIDWTPHGRKKRPRIVEYAIFAQNSTCFLTQPQNSSYNACILPS